MAKLFRNQLAVPLGLLLAFVAAVGVWFIPINPERRAASGSSGGQASWQQRIAGSSPTAAPARPSSASWNRPQPTGLADLAPTLAGLREPPPELPTIVEAPDDPEPEQETIAIPSITLDWEYQGSVTANSTRAAMLMIDGRQRFLFEGDSIANPDDPSGDRVRIRSVQSMFVVAETQGVEIRLPLSSLTPEQRAAVLAEGGQASIPSGPRTIPAPRPASATDIARQRAAAAAAAANRGQPNRAQPNRAQPNQPIAPRTVPGRAPANNQPGKATPPQPTRTPAQPQREQPQREQPRREN